MSGHPDLDAISAELAAQGLIPRGGFDFGTDEESPAGLSGAPARSVLLVGQAGAGPWPRFKSWLKRQEPPPANPLDTWARDVIAAVAARHMARAVSPSDRPWLPFQQWAMRAEKLRASPLGVLMHPDWGLWHAYRGALLFETRLGFAEPHEAIHPCAACSGKPCLFACPVGAYSQNGFDHAACLAHVRSPEGRACMETGCLARNACPAGERLRYPAEVQAFHMAAFAGPGSIQPQ